MNGSWYSAGMRFQTSALMTVAPTSGAQPMSSMLGASANHWVDRAYSGVLGKPSISPLCSEGMISVDWITTGLKPAWRKPSTAASSPSQQNTLIWAASSGVRMGSLVKKWAQPASPQFRTM